MRKSTKNTKNSAKTSGTKKTASTKDNSQKRSCKLSDTHIHFICKKIGEGNFSQCQIAELFNNIYGKGRGKITISSEIVHYYSHHEKWLPVINDYRQVWSQTLDQLKYADTSNLILKLQELAEQAMGKGQIKTAMECLKAIKDVTSKGNEGDQDKSPITINIIRQAIRDADKEKEEFLIEYDPEEDKQYEAELDPEPEEND